MKSATPGGKTLAKHLEEAENLKLIEEGRWDVVVLQGQSQEAAKPEPVGNIRSSFLIGAHDLCLRIRAASPQARVVFYETWAHHADYWKNAKADRNVGKDAAEIAGAEPIFVSAEEAPEVRRRSWPATLLHESRTLAFVCVYGRVSTEYKTGCAVAGNSGRPRILLLPSPRPPATITHHEPENRLNVVAGLNLGAEEPLKSIPCPDLVGRQHPGRRACPRCSGLSHVSSFLKIPTTGQPGGSDHRLVRFREGT